MTTKISLIGSALLISLSIITVKAQQTRTVDNFTGIKAGDELHITLIQADTSLLKINAPENIQSQIKSEVKDGILTLSTEGNIKDDQDITITITVKSLNSLEIFGAASIKSENKLTCDNMALTSEGIGDIDLEITATEIKSKIGGTGNVTLRGSTQFLEAVISGTGNLKATDLEANKVIARVSGTGDAKINVSQSLNADVSGAGSVIYKGSPVDRAVNISGAGSVRESKIGTGEETASDTTKIKWGNKRYMIIDEEENKDDDASSANSKRGHKENFKYWNGFDIGVNGFLDNKGTLNTPAGGEFLELNYAKSIQFGINAFQKNFHLFRNYINIFTGLGINFNHYAFEKNITLKTNMPYISATVDSTIEYKKNTLNVTYLKVPLMLEINTSKNPNQNFHIAAGIEVDYRIHAVTKQRYEVNDKHISKKQRDAFNLEPFSYSFAARVGYNNITVYATYGFSRLFKKDKGPQVYPFAVGITMAI